MGMLNAHWLLTCPPPCRPQGRNVSYAPVCAKIVSNGPCKNNCNKIMRLKDIIVRNTYQFFSFSCCQLGL